jgi:VanZ family protein
VLLAVALMPSGVVPVAPSDNLQHFVSFLALGILGFGWVSTRSILMFTALTSLGGAIELLQPLFGREADFLDWLADVAGVAAALTIVAIAQARRRSPWVQ